MQIVVVIVMMVIEGEARGQLPPEQMAIYAAIIGCLSVAGGLGISLQWDTPVGPSTVCIATALFAIALFAIAFALPGHLKTWASSRGS